MIEKSITLLADIGGTHIRLAQDSKAGPLKPEKRPAAAYPDLQSALAAYCARHNLPAQGRVAIGTAAHPDENNIWCFQNLNEWRIDPAALASSGWDVRVLVNDFVASSCGALLIPEQNLITLRAGRGDGGSRYVVLGPGTGLGLGYVEKIGTRLHVQETLGGHMIGACATDEQYMIAKLVTRLRGGPMNFIYEDVCSGVGLPLLYRALCIYHGQTPLYKDAAALFAHHDDPIIAATLRLFHEFWGLYTHNALVTGHGFGGVYLDGGLTQHLLAHGLFDRASFFKYMTLEPAAIVRQKIDDTPVHIINDPYVALYGLSHLIKYQG